MKKLSFLLITLLLFSSCISSGIIIKDTEREAEDKVITISVGFHNFYLIETAAGYIMVDTGLWNEEEEIDTMFLETGINPEEVEYIILTHGHQDHTGNTAYVKKITGAQVICHQNMAHVLETGESEPIIPRNWVGSLLEFITPKMTLEGVTPDILVEKEFDMAPLGIEGKLIYTPGHTTGSICILLNTGELLIGDLMRGTASEPSLGMFYEDEAVLLESLKKLAAMNVRKIYQSHGDSVGLDSLTKLIGAYE